VQRNLNTFTGEYTAYHRPQAQEPHGCEYGIATIYTVHHIVLQCPLFRAAHETHINPVSPTPSIDIIFGTKASSESLAKFIKAIQACVRLRKHTLPPEDHGKYITTPTFINPTLPPSPPT
jgi:hypothetical protein